MLVARVERGARLSQGLLAEGLQLFALCGLALAAPLLEILARHPGFLIAHALVGVALAATVAGLLVLPPLAAWLALRAIALAAPRAAGALRAGLAGALAGAFALPALRALPGAPAAVALAAAAALALAAGLAFARRRGVRAFAALLAPLPLLPAALLFRDARIARLLAPPPAPRLAPEAVADLPPVVMVIFDELPTTSLLDADGRIDAARYPAFAELARHATWFPRASSAGASTLEAVPAILTGRRPDPARLATWADHPENLFSLLAGAYALHVHESQTILHAGGDAAARTRAGGVASDLGVLWLHAVLPAGLAARLPDVEHTWGDFAWPDAAELAQRSERGYRGRSNHFADFVAAIEPCARPCLYFHHTLLPHVPWLHAASGRKYQPTAIPGLRREFWGPEPWWVVEGYQRHLLQLAYADRLLGSLLARLRRTELFERALVVVTADHGTSFWPGASRRDPDLASHPEDVLRVPLLVKRPGQTQGSVDPRPVESVDVLPTIAALLGIALPWRVDGCSAFDPACPERREQAMVDNGGNRWAFSVEALDGRESLERKLALFGTRSGAAGLYRVGPYRRWVGRAVAGLPQGPAAGVRIEVDAGGFALAQANPAAWAACRIVGRFEAPPGPAERPYVAIATRGVLQALVPALPGPEGALVFAAQIPEDAFDGDVAQLGLFLVTGELGAPLLHPAEVAPGEVGIAAAGTGFEPPPRGAVR
jgi:hypothetical protein